MKITEKFVHASLIAVSIIFFSGTLCAQWLPRPDTKKPVKPICSQYKDNSLAKECCKKVLPDLQQSGRTMNGDDVKKCCGTLFKENEDKRSCCVKRGAEQAMSEIEKCAPGPIGCVKPECDKMESESDKKCCVLSDRVANHKPVPYKDFLPCYCRDNPTEQACCSLPPNTLSSYFPKCNTQDDSGCPGVTGSPERFCCRVKKALDNGSITDPKWKEYADKILACCNKGFFTPATNSALVETDREIYCCLTDQEKTCSAGVETATHR